MVATGLQELSTIPKFEYVWFEQIFLDKEDKIKTVSLPSILNTTMETLQAQKEKNLKLLMSLG